MSEDRHSDDQDDRSWLQKITHLFSTEPHTRDDLMDVLAISADNEVIDEDARSIMEGAMQVTDRLEVRLSGLNLLDLHYRTFGSGISAPGRNVRATLSARF